MDLNNFFPKPQLLFTALLTAGAFSPAMAAPISQGMPTELGAIQEGSNNHLGMSRSGRYVAFNNKNMFYVRDIKTQTSVKLADKVDHNMYAISPNGRYIATHRAKAVPNTGLEAVIFDRVTLTEVVVPAEISKNIALSDNGYALFNTATNRQLVRYNIKDQQQQTTSITNADLGSLYHRNSLSADGQIALFSVAGSYKLYNFATNQVVNINPQAPGGVPLPIDNSSSPIGLASSGKFLAFTSGTSAVRQNALYRLNLDSTQQTADVFDMTSKMVRVESGVSITGNGRFITFAGAVVSGHPDWAIANAISPDIHGNGYPRIMRYDTQLDQLVIMSTANGGGPLESKSGGCCIPLQPLVNNISIVSDDGSMVEFATSSPTVSPIPNPIASEANYHAYVSNGFARNYQFVDMPNSDIAFKAYAPMTLVGNNQWEGTITFDGVGTEGLKFDVGGTLVNGKFTATPNWGINFGAGATAGQSVAGGGNIAVTGGAGTYKVTFNDQTLQYTVTKQHPTADWKRTVVMIFGETQTGQDMFIRGGLDHQQALTHLGRNCTATPELCSMPIRHLNTLNPTTAPWKQGDTKLDWQGVEAGQSATAQGSPLDWTTNLWPTSWGAKKTVALNGFGETPLNLWGHHYWLLDVEMDCSRSVNGWFELKSFISNGPGWENNITQTGTLPWASINHFAQCGKLNVFKRNQNAPVTIGNL